MIRNLGHGLLIAFLFSHFVPAVAAEKEYGQVLIIEPGRFLTADDRIRLEQSGVRVLRELGRDRYLVRRDRTIASTASRIPALENGVEQTVKLRGAYEALEEGNGSARLQVLFHDDVPYDDALRAVIGAGGEPLSMMSGRFSSGRGIDARLSAGAVEALRHDTRIQMIRHRPLRLENDNAVAASMSNVDDVREALDLTGEGVVASLYEISPMQADHVEFEGRATGIPGATPDTHATHVAGTIAAAGLRPEARGMAPKARIVSHVVDLDFSSTKLETFTQHRPSVDNNSWSFVVGWNYDSTRSLNWEWWGFTDDFGAYTAEAEALDRLSMLVPTLMVYSAGNDNTDAGPSITPFAHYHGNSDAIWCISPSGNGGDCTSSPCATTRCETTRHPSDGPWTTLSQVGAMKNGLAVGAIAADRQLASFSSRGPAVDGRVKPDVVAKGINQYSTVTNNQYGYLQGTSMAAPVVTGVGAVLTEQWRRTFHGDPRPEYLKTLIIHGAEDLGPAGPDYRFGFGLVDAARSAEVLTSSSDTNHRVATGALSREQRWQSTMTLNDGDEVRLTLGWADPANVGGTIPALVNDLDLLLTSPEGEQIRPWILDPENPDTAAIRGRNTVDNTEQIEWSATSSGVWRIEVTGTGVSTTAGQPFILISSHDITPGRIACLDPYEPNETAGTASGVLPSGRTVRASLCGSADRDFFRFTLDEGGDILASVTSEVPLRISIVSDAMVLGSVEVPAGAGRDLMVRFGIPDTVISPTTLVVRIEPLSGAEGEYTLRVDWPGAPPSLRRGTRR